MREIQITQILIYSHFLFFSSRSSLEENEANGNSKAYFYFLLVNTQTILEEDGYLIEA